MHTQIHPSAATGTNNNVNARMATRLAHPAHQASAAGQWLRLLVVLGATVALGACGGGDDGPAVASIDAAAPLAYGKQAVFTVAGPGLESSQVAVTTTGCKGLALVTGSTATLKQVACTVTGVTEVKLETKAADGTPLLARTFAVLAPKVELRTSMGTVVLDLYPAKAPATVLNFLVHVNKGFYDGTLLHRVVPRFVVQGGGYTPGPVYKPAPLPAIALEATGLLNTRGMVGMARTAQPDTATTEFYVNLQDNPVLDPAGTDRPGYAVFAQVVQGMPLFDTLAGQPTQLVGALNNVPVTDVVVQAAVQVQ